MKATGIIRKVDDLGRLVLPSELRNSMNIKKNDPIEVFVEGESIVLKKYQVNNQCIVTGNISDFNEEIEGLLISPEGARILFKALKSKFGGK